MEAAAFLDAQARSYADTPQFQDLMERVRRRGVAEVLDRQLAEGQLQKPGCDSPRRPCARIPETKRLKKGSP